MRTGPFHGSFPGGNGVKSALHIKSEIVIRWKDFLETTLE